MALMGLVGFVLVFVMLIPQCQTFLQGTVSGASAFLHDWAPYSYVLLALIATAPMVSAYLLYTWPPREEPENPMAKYNRETPLDD